VELYDRLLKKKAQTFIPEENTRTTERRWIIPTCAKDIIGKKRRLYHISFPLENTIK
jgi:hypothetical protein